MRMDLSVMKPAFGAAVVAALLSGCSMWSSGVRVHEPTPLADFVAQATIETRWQGSVGAAESFAFQPAATDGRIYAAAANGAVREVTGGRFQAESSKPLAAGVGAGEGRVAVVSQRGDVLVYDTAGKLAWQASLGAESLAPPLIAAHTVVAKAADGRLTGFDVATGARRWQVNRTLPSLTLRNVGAAATDGDVGYFGMAGGKLIAVDLARGGILWEATVAQPRGATELERVTDVVSAPVYTGRSVCAVAYRGRVACFDPKNGNGLWARDVGSDKGIATDGRYIYVTDSNGSVYAFDRDTGASAWRQDKLMYRDVSGPAMIGRYLAVVDGEGWMHVLSREDGHFVARRQIGGDGASAQPITVDQTLVVQTNSGSVLGLSVR